MERLVFDLVIGWSQDGRQDRPKRAPGGVLGRLGGGLGPLLGALGPLLEGLRGLLGRLEGSWATLTGFGALFGFD